LHPNYANIAYLEQEPFTGIERVYYRLFGTRMNLVKMGNLEKDQFLQLLLGKKLFKYFHVPVL
jgi:hypothetical protein